MTDEPVLTAAELACLLEVPTTPEQARQILSRNQQALAMLLSDEPGTVDIGCPHCLDAKEEWKKQFPDAPTTGLFCKTCAYTKTVDPADTLGGHCACCTYSFGGHCYDDDVDAVVRLTSVSLDVDATNESFMSVRHAKVWLRGHIEWAEEVLRRAGPGAAPAGK